MHSRLLNELVLQLRLRPRTPFLIKTGDTGEALDPTLPDMRFVRTHRPGSADDEVYIPGSSLRGVLRSHAERLVRSIDSKKACNIVGGKTACKPENRLSGPEAYRGSCYTCRLFGNTGLAARARVSDFYPTANDGVFLETRYGVAIDRVTGAVGHGPFEMETVTDGWFEGQVTLRNFTIGQLGLLGGAILDMADGLVPIGYGKSRGLGRVELRLSGLTLRYLRDPEGSVRGIGELLNSGDLEAYGLPKWLAEQDHVETTVKAIRQGPFWSFQLNDDSDVRTLLDAATPRWLEEVGGR